MKSNGILIERFSDEQVAHIVFKAKALVAEDAQPALVRHLYEMAYKYNERGSSASFSYELGQFLAKL